MAFQRICTVTLLEKSSKMAQELRASTRGVAPQHSETEIAALRNRGKMNAPPISRPPSF